jgi:hypothetical protein
MPVELLELPPARSAAIWRAGGNGTGSLPPQTSRAFHELEYLASPVGTVDVVVGCHANFWLAQDKATTLNNPSGTPSSGDIINIVFVQDAIGGRTLAFGDKYYFFGAQAPDFDTAANAINFLCAIYFAPQDIWLCSWLAGFSPLGA